MIPITNAGSNYSFPEKHKQYKQPYFFSGVCNGHSTIRKQIATLSMFSQNYKLPSGLSSSERMIIMKKFFMIYSLEK